MRCQSVGEHKFYLRMITSVDISKFTAFNKLLLKFSPGINVFIGENGTGKTHILKMLYSAYSIIGKGEKGDMLAQKVNRVFRPDKDELFRLVHRQQGNLGTGKFQVTRMGEDGKERHVRLEITRKSSQTFNLKIWGSDTKNQRSVYIPVKDMLANAPGFKALYDERMTSYEEIYADVITKALLPAVKGKPSPAKQELFSLIQELIGGTVVEKNEHFFLHNQQGNLEFSLLAEGFRKLGLIFTLIQNDTLSANSVVFWDEPEANLNPKLAKQLASIIVKLQQLGVQIFIATHDYIFLRELEMAVLENKCTDYRIFSLYHNEEKEVVCEEGKSVEKLNVCAIDEAYDSLLLRTLQNSWE